MEHHLVFVTHRKLFQSVERAEVVYIHHTFPLYLSLPTDNGGSHLDNQDLITQ